MDMKINATEVKRLRKKKLWSQEQLATACGLSLRTIQRLEGEGQASPETVKALAAVFEVAHEDLQWSPSETVGYANVQLGYVLTLIFVALISLAAVFFSSGKINLPIFGLITLSCLIPLVLFSTLTSRVTKSHLEWHFSLGFLKRSVPLEQIVKWEQVRNKAWWGLGIRLTPVGWVYCVSGLDAVAMKFSNGKKIRIGTDDPDGLVKALENARG